MKGLLTSVIIFSFFTKSVLSQTNCSNPRQVSICPSVYLTNQTNAGMLDDAPAAFNYSGEDLVYEITAPAGTSTIFISVTNLTGMAHLTMQKNICGSTALSFRTLYAGTYNISFTVTPPGNYFLWVDAPATINYNISFGADTGSVYVNIPNTRGNILFDGTCTSNVFSSTKPYFSVSYNGVFQTNPMTLSPLFVPGIMCVKSFFKNTSGIEGVKQFIFFFDPSGFSNFNGPSIIPGFYNSGNWIRTIFGQYIDYTFVDSAGTGKGDFTGTPNTCLGYTFCFNIVPLSNNPQNTNVGVQILTDGFGAPWNGWVYSGCCPFPNQYCHFGGPGSSGFGTQSFGFSFADPGGSLPIELVNFDAVSEKGKVLLKWTTASEINNDFFTINRSQNGNDWTELGRVKAVGNSTEMNSYSFVDIPYGEGTWYYQLKQTDVNGVSTLSKINEVNFKGRVKINIVPNPSSNYFAVESAEIKNYQFNLYNNIGQRINVPIFFEGEKDIFDIRHLPNGLYLLRISDSKELIQLEKIIVE